MKSKRYSQDELKLRASIAQPAGSKLARYAKEKRIGRNNAGLNPDAKRKPKKAKAWKPYAKR